MKSAIVFECFLGYVIFRYTMDSGFACRKTVLAGQNQQAVAVLYLAYCDFAPAASLCARMESDGNSPPDHRAGALPRQRRQFNHNP